MKKTSAKLKLHGKTIADIPSQKGVCHTKESAGFTQSEAQIQASCVTWLWNNHPETRGLFFAVTNNSEHVARAMQRKAVGLVPGVADCLFMWRGKTYCFEFKNLTGRQSPAQYSWQDKVNNHGFDYFVVRSLDDFKLILSINGIL